MDSYDIKMYPAIKEEEEAFECDKFESRIYEGSGFCRQLRYLIVRSGIHLWRNPQLLKARTLQTFIIAFFCLSIYWKLTNDMQGVNNKVGAIFFVVINQMMDAIFTVLLNF